MKLNIDLFKKLSETPGAPGFEHRIRQLILAEVTSLVDHVAVDNMGNILTLKKGKEAANKKVMLAAHMDELGLIVRNIDQDGFIRFHTLGGFDAKTLLAQRVIVHGQQDLVGVIGAKSVHFMNEEERKKPVDIKQLYIDLGRSQQDVAKYVTVGDPITRERDLIELGDCISGKSLDNRTGVFVLIEALRTLPEVPYDVHAVFTVQEEVGIRGAQVAAHHIDPDFSIAIDVTTSLDLSDIPDHDKGATLGQGAGIKIMDSRTICDYRMVQYLRAVATQQNIAWQHDLKNVGDTDTSALQRTGPGGSIAGALTIPIRYGHQVVEVVHQSDVAACIQLVQAALTHINTYDWQHS